MEIRLALLMRPIFCAIGSKSGPACPLAGKKTVFGAVRGSYARGCAYFAFLWPTKNIGPGAYSGMGVWNALKKKYRKIWR